MFNHFSEPVSTGAWFVEKPIFEQSIMMQVAILAVMMVFVVIAIVYAARLARQESSRFPLYICIGIALAAFYEPFGDLFAHVVYHEANQINFTSAFGFRVPLWVWPSYVGIFGLPVLILVRKLETSEFSMSWWMPVFFAGVIGGWLWEIPMIKLGYVEYYGANAPFKLLGYPIWMGFANGATMLVVTTAVYFLKHSVVGRHYPFLIIPMFPMLLMAANGGAALPLASAINSSDSSAVVNIFAFVSMAAATLYVWICGQLLAAHGVQARAGANREARAV